MFGLGIRYPPPYPPAYPPGKREGIGAVKYWSLTLLREKLVEIGARIVGHGRSVMFQMAEVAVSRSLFGEILQLIDGLGAQPTPA